MVTAKKKTAEISYNAENIESLGPIESVRVRPGMYVGATNGPDGSHHLWKEIFVGNAGDEITAGYADTASTRILADGSIEVTDNGRGIPCDADPKSPIGESVLVRIFTTLHSGSKFDTEQSVYKSASVGMNGVGSCVTNALSKRLDICVYRDGQKYEVSFKRGIPGTFENDSADSKFTKTPANKKAVRISKDTRSAAEKKAMKTGTVIRYLPDDEIWAMVKPDFKKMCDETKALSYMISRGTFVMKDDRTEEEYSFHNAGGIRDKIADAVNGIAVSPVIAFKDEGTIVKHKPVFENGEVVRYEDEEQAVQVEAAFAYTEDDETYIRSYANTMYTKYGGTAHDGFRRGLSRAIGEYIRNTKGCLKSTENSKDLKIEDIVDSGIIGDISVMLPEPLFVGQTKDELANQEVTSIVSDLTKNHVTDWLVDKKNARHVKSITTKVVEAMRYRLKLKDEKETQKKQTEIEKSSSLPSKLVDCSAIGDGFSELLICEGDSALGTMKAARDSCYQAIFPLKGKVLNVLGATKAKMLDDDECSGMIATIGAGLGKGFELEQMRYHNVIIFADADEDGNHIRCLIIAFFWKYMRPMIEDGRLYTAVPPLYMLKTLGRNQEILLLADEEEKTRELARLKRAKVKYEQPARMKGLGEMNPDEFWDTSLNPETRRLRKITVDDVNTAEEMLVLALGKHSGSAANRREWISKALHFDDLTSFE